MMQDFYRQFLFQYFNWDAFREERAVMWTFLLLWPLPNLGGYSHGGYRREKGGDDDEVEKAERVNVCHERAMGAMAERCRWD